MKVFVRVLFAALFLGACEHKGAIIGVDSTSSITAGIRVTPAVDTLLVSQTRQIVVTPLNPATNPIALDGSVSFQSSNTAIVTVDGQGRVTAVAPGSAVVLVTYKTFTGQSVFVVLPTPGGPSSSFSVFISPPSAVIGINGTAQFTATARNDATGAIVAGTATWTSSNDAVASVSSSGLVTGKSAGNATVRATINGKSADATVTVLGGPNTLTVTPAGPAVSAGQTLQMTATVRDQAGNVVQTGPVAWSSSNTAAATINANGLVSAIAAGTTTITATSGGVTGSTQVTVVGGTGTGSGAGVASVTVSPSTLAITEGASGTLTATVKDSEGHTLARQVTWSSSNTAVATVSPSGVVTGNSAGTATITATAEGKSGTAQVTVSKAAVASVTISPTTMTLAPGGSGQLTVTARDQNGTPLTGRTVTFTSSNNAVATVSASGVVTGVTPGSATITATVEGKTATAQVTVTSQTVGSVEITPSAPQVCVGNSTQLTATVRDAGGNILTGVPVTFSSSNTAVANVSSSGLLTGVAAGSAVITASAGGRSATINATICLNVAATITLSPANTTIALGATLQLQATVRDAAGAILSGQPITFTSSNNAVATVTATGTVVALGRGTATITALVNGKTATSVITVI
jgi:trimeric autotransporter adhesin